MKKQKPNPQSKFFLATGGILTVVGLIFVVNAFSGMTGFIIVQNTAPPESGLIGTWLMAFGATFLSLARKKKKGQAAMEFLMTYGWAILATIISISVLAYIGLSNGALFSPQVAIIGPPFKIHVAATYSDTEDYQSLIVMEISNEGYSNLIFTNGVVEGNIEGQSASCGGAISVPGGGQLTISQGQRILIGMACGDENYEIGDMLTGDITFTYRKPGSNIDSISLGEISQELKDQETAGLTIAAVKNPLGSGPGINYDTSISQGGESEPEGPAPSG